MYLVKRLTCMILYVCVVLNEFKFQRYLNYVSLLGTLTDCLIVFSNSDL